MKHLHTRTRRLVATVLFVGAVGLAATLAVSALSTNARGASSAGNTVSFYKKSKLLGSIQVVNGSTLDVVWKDGTCSAGYASPPSVFTWSGTKAGGTSAPVLGPCARLRFPDDFECTFNTSPPVIDCSWTYNKGTSSARIANSVGGTVGNLYLFKRVALYASHVQPGHAKRKISVPAGADTIVFSAGG
jgi:hypothetical protein